MMMMMMEGSDGGGGNGDGDGNAMRQPRPLDLIPIRELMMTMVCDVMWWGYGIFKAK